MKRSQVEQLQARADLLEELETLHEIQQAEEQFAAGQGVEHDAALQKILTYFNDQV